MRAQKGITLVALIITIIVLLILAVVTIAAVNGDGVIEKSQIAANAYSNEADAENTALAGWEATMQPYIDAASK